MSSPIQPSGTSTPSSSRTSVSAANSRPATRSSEPQLVAAFSSARAPGRCPPARTASRRPRGPAPRRTGSTWRRRRAPVGAVEERVEHADLVGHLGAADDRHQRPLRFLEDPVQRRDLALDQPSRGRRQQVRHRLGRGVRAVRGAEGVVDVDVGERGVALGQLGVVLRLPRLVADVLEHHDFDVGDLVEVWAPARPRPRAARAAARPPASARTPAPVLRAARGGRAARAARRPSRAAPPASGARRGCARRR